MICGNVSRSKTDSRGSELPRLMLVTNRRRTRGRELVPLVAQAVEGGVGVVQIREPDLPDDALCELAGRIREVVPPSTIIVINGSLRAARTLDTGLHLPAAAPPLGDDERHAFPIYGRSVHDDREARVAIDDRASYVIVGTIYPTDSKPGHPGAGSRRITEIRRLVAPLPIYSIGGVTVTQIPELVHAGAHGVAVCGALLGTNHPRRVAQAMHLALEVAVLAEGAGPLRAPRAKSS